MEEQEHYILQIVDGKIEAFGNLVKITDKDDVETPITNIEVTKELYDAAYEDKNSFDFEEHDEYIPKYIYRNNEIILDPDYDKRCTIREKKERIRDIKEELNELDLKSIRSIRANETSRIEQYDAEAQELRAEMNRLLEDITEIEQEIDE